MGAHQDRDAATGADAALETVLQARTGAQLLDVEPRPDAPLGKGLCQGDRARLVFAVVAQKAIV